MFMKVVFFIVLFFSSINLIFSSEFVDSKYWSKIQKDDDCDINDEDCDEEDDDEK